MKTLKTSIPKTRALPKEVASIFRAIDSLEKRYPGRKFTIDGHLLGSIGEVVAQKWFGFELLPMSAPGHDAKCKKRGLVQIKITAKDKIALRASCKWLVVFQIVAKSQAALIYDGPGGIVWSNAGKKQSNGQRVIPLSKLKSLISKSAHRKKRL